MAVWFYLKNQFFADKGFKLLTFDEFFSPYIKNKRAIGLPQHIVNFIDSDIAVSVSATLRWIGTGSIGWLTDNPSIK